MSESDLTKPHLYGAPDPAHDADQTVPPVGLHGEQKATSGAGYKREIEGEDRSSITVEEASGVAAAEAAGTKPDHLDR